MWQFGLMTSVVSKFIIDKDRMDPQLHAKIKKVTKNITEYGELVNSLDVANPISWVTTASTLVDKYYGENKVAVEMEVEEFEERIYDEFQMAIFSNFDLIQCLEMLIANYSYKFVPVFKTDEPVEAGVIRPGYYHFDIKGKSLGCYYSEYDDKTYFIPKRFEVKSFKEQREYFLDVLGEVSLKIWGKNKALVISNREGKSSFEEVSVTPFDVSEQMYWGPLDQIAERWPKYRKANIRRTCIIQGKPGTGKTTFCYWLANQISNKTLIFDGRYIAESNNQDISDAITFLRPEMIILNDIHYMSTERLETTLALFEEGSTDLKVPYTVCTSNDMSLIPPPLQRPGRLGDEIYIVDDMVMSDEVRAKIIKGFEDKVGYKVPDKYKEDFFFIYKNLSESEAFLVEILKRAKVEGEHVIEDFIEKEKEAIMNSGHEDDYDDDYENEYYEEY